MKIVLKLVLKYFHSFLCCSRHQIQGHRAEVDMNEITGSVSFHKKTMPYNKLLTNLVCSSRTGEYWPSVVDLGPLFPSRALALG